MTKKLAAVGTKYVYAVTRLDLPQPHRTVQVAHAVLAAAHAYGIPATHPHLVLCAVADEAALTDLFERLKEQQTPCCAYHENDLDNALTALATAPLVGDARKPLRRLDLLPG